MRYARGGMAAAYGVSRRKKMARGGLLPHEDRIPIPPESQEHLGSSHEEQAREAAYSHLAKGGKAQKFVKGEMHKFGEGELHSGSKQGPKVTDPKQAIAIALSQAREKGMKVPHAHVGGEMREKFLDAARKAKMKHMAKGGEIPKEDHGREYDESVIDANQPQRNQKLEPGTGEAPETADLDHLRIEGKEFGRENIDQPVEQQTGRHYLPEHEDEPHGMRGNNALHHKTWEGHHPVGPRQESFEFSGTDQKAEDYRNMAEGGPVHEPEGPQHDHEFEHLDENASDYKEMSVGGSVHSPLTIAIGIRKAKKMAAGGELEPEYNYLSENDSYPDPDMREWETLDYDRLDHEQDLHADHTSHEYKKMAHGGEANKIPKGHQDYPYMNPGPIEHYNPGKVHYKNPYVPPNIRHNMSKKTMYAADGGEATSPTPTPPPVDPYEASKAENSFKNYSSTDALKHLFGDAEGGEVKKKRLAKIMASLSGLGE